MRGGIVSNTFTADGAADVNACVGVGAGAGAGAGSGINTIVSF
jgi:hypothetical protein